jgi:uncharacterized membrane protein YfcA
MLLGSNTLPVMTIFFFAACLRSTFGFGDALIAMPFLLLLVGIRTATPLVALTASTIALTILIRNWQKVEFQSAWRLILSTIAGIPIGLFLLKTAPDSWMKSILAGVLILFSLYRLSHPKGIILKSERWAFVFGFFSGILGGSLNTNGPPVVIYGTLRRWPPESFRATLQGYFFPTGLVILMGHGAAGLWTAPVLQMFLLIVPVILLAVYIGGRLNVLIPAAKFDTIIYGLLFIVGLLLGLQTVGVF